MNRINKSIVIHDASELRLKYNLVGHKYLFGKGTRPKTDYDFFQIEVRKHILRLMY